MSDLRAEFEEEQPWAERERGRHGRESTMSGHDALGLDGGPGSATPDLDALERMEGVGYTSDGTEAMERIQYPPDRGDTPDASTALLGGRRKPRDSVWRLLLATFEVRGIKIPWLLPPLVFLFLLFLLRPRWAPAPLPLLSNGTHSFHPTTVVVSMDGFRAGYLTSHADSVPHLRALAASGVSAEMTPVFPTLTFPNHWSMLTGLYPSAHGIVANTFFRPSKGVFDYRKKESMWLPHWWGGEPLWSVAERGGRRAVNFMWPGPPKTAAGIEPSFFHPYQKIDPTAKLTKLLHYFDLPPETAPSLLFMYLPDVDQAGHAGGPDSDKVSSALRRVDDFVGGLRGEIGRRNMSHIVDLVVLSDHGMAPLAEDRILFFEDILGSELYKDIAHKDGWPSYGLWFTPGLDYAPHLAALQRAARNASFGVYTHDNMPERWHFRHADHVAPVYVVPDLGWIISDHDEYGSHGLDVLGAHGYDNALPEMHSVFFADGPAAGAMKARAGSEGWVSASPAVLEGFHNTEIYGLVTRLQRLVPPAHNGTDGFWDRYLGPS